MKAQSDLYKELLDMERFGSIAVRETFQTTMEQQLCGEKMADLADVIISIIDRNYNRRENELLGTYFFLYENLSDYAREHLSREEYHLFCEWVSNHCLLPYLYGTDE